MEKQIIKVNYFWSGIRTLRCLGVFLMIIALLFLVAIIFTIGDAINKGYYDNLPFLVILNNVMSSLLYPITIYTVGTICIIISAFFKKPLYERALFENQYDFYEYERLDAKKGEQKDTRNKTNNW